ncbi:MAG: hypothetical protein HUU20_02550 [Pirellulales bacterium]|nr:hypothetical protein [Pirellulales bacterium]
MQTLQRYADALDCQLEINVVSADVAKHSTRGAAG